MQEVNPTHTHLEMSVGWRGGEKVGWVGGGLQIPSKSADWWHKAIRPATDAMYRGPTSDTSRQAVLQAAVLGMTTVNVTWSRRVSTHGEEVSTEQEKPCAKQEAKVSTQL